MEGTLADRLTSYDATALAEEIRSRSLSATEVVAAHYERIEQLNRKYNALVTLDETRAMQRAAEADADLKAGKLWGPLHGVPITIKDAVETKGLRTTAGHRSHAALIPASDAWVVNRLKEAGAIVIGKSNCAELCMDIQTTNKVFGTTNNPWNLERTSGGSSGGDAVAVALGMSALGIGSDTGGSIRIPSSYCGVFGFKPSIGKISRAGLRPVRDESHPRPDSLTVIGPMARSVRDLMLCYKILTNEQRAEADPCSEVRKIYWSQEFDHQPVDDEVAAVMRSKRVALMGRGVNVEEIKMPVAFGKLTGMYLRMINFEFLPSEYGRVLHYLLRIIESARSIFSGGFEGGYRRLKRDQGTISRALEESMAGSDCWVLPATPTVAFAHRKPQTRIPLTVAGQQTTCSYLKASMGFTFPINILGNPSVVIPVGRSKEGLPIAVQLVGKRGQDWKLLEAASFLSGVIADAEFARR